MTERSIILLVEDREDDILLVRRAFSAANLDAPLQVVRDGEEAIAYLEGIGKYQNREEFPLPDLVLLDLKLPGLDGYDVLQWIRSNPALKALRVIVLTSSEEIRDVNKAYSMGANSFLVKPFEFTNYPALINSLSKFWLEDSRKPEVSRPAKPVETGNAS
jgi:CheY-like chemotaxis protein